MIIFTTERIDLVNGIQIIEQLYIIKKAHLNPIGQLDNFELNLEAKDKSSFKRLMTILGRVINNESLPQTLFKEVSRKNDNIKEYEVKANNLRLYLIKIKHGKLIILGGYKNTQKQDFVKFRNLKQQYINYLNESK